MEKIINCVKTLNKGVIDTANPFIFLVQHKDNQPRGNGKMQAPRTGNGQDFDRNADYRMQHGSKIPGFPKHPHRGIETFTATLEGQVDHADSYGNCGRQGNGDIQQMLSGNGVQHSEMFPLINEDKNNPLRFFQVWLNIPKINKMVEPSFKMHWAEEIKHYTEDNVDVILWVGSYKNIIPKETIKNSWSYPKENDVKIWLIKLNPDGLFIIPESLQKNEINRELFFIEGEKVKVCDKIISKNNIININASFDTSILNISNEICEILLLQGRPINEPKCAYGPFVMNTKEEINQAQEDYYKTEFGGWPWKSDDPVFDKDKGRFAIFNGKEETPDNI